MTLSTFEDLNQKMGELFQAGSFQAAFELVEKEGGKFPANRIMIDYWRMCAAARVVNLARLIEVAEAFHKEGIWFGEMMWRMTPSFKALQGNAEFERIVKKSLEIQMTDGASLISTELRFIPKNVPADSPLMIALHGNQSTAERTLPFWKPAVRQGVALIVPQSTQAMFKGAYMWDDLDTSFAQVKKCWAKAQRDLQFDPARLILAGHSMGGFVAIHMALTGELPVRGLIVNGPALPFEDAPEALENALHSAKERGLKAYFIMGSEDEDIERDAIRDFVAKIKSAGIACKLDIVPGVRHAYDPAYDAAFLRGLKFVN